MSSLICIVALCIAQAPPPPPLLKSEVPEHLAHPRGYKAKPQTPYWTLSIPKVMDVDEWKRYVEFLSLSNAQVSALAGAYDQYRRTDWDFRVRNTQALWDRSAELASEGTRMTADLAARRIALLDDSERVLPRIAQIEREFFAEVAGFLSEPQLSLLEVVRQLRERQSDRQFVSTFPGFSFDIDATLLAMRVSDVDLVPKDADAFEGLVQAWRSAAGALYARHAEEYRRMLKHNILIRADMTSAGESGQTALAVELRERMCQAREPLTKLARRILDLHREYTRMLVDVLPEAAGQHLITQFEQQAYPPFSPDPGDLTSVLSRAAKVGFSQTQREQFVRLVEEWTTLSQPAWDRIVKEYLSWHEEINTNSGYNREKYPAYAKRMSDACAARIASSSATIDALVALMSSAQRKEVAKEIKAWRARVDAFNASQEPVKARYKAWPGPTD